MQFKIFKAKTDDTLSQNNSFRFALSIVTILVLGEGVIIGWLATNQRTVFMPPGNITKEFWIEGSSVSKTYLDMVIGHVSERLLNLTPENARKSMSTILPYVKSSYYGEYKKQIEQQADYLAQNNISQIFYLQDMDYSKSGVADVRGILSSVIGDKIISSKQIHLNVKYEVKNSNFTILNIALNTNQEQATKIAETNKGINNEEQ